MATYNIGRKFEVVRRQSGGVGSTVKYVVTGPGGTDAGGPFRSFADAARWRDACQREADRKAKRGPRPCMCCGETFKSEGIHHRMCGRCRSRGDDGSMSIPASSNAKVKRAAGA